VNSESDPGIIAQFERMGAAQVRVMLPTYSGLLRGQAVAWLKQKDQEAEDTTRDATARASAAAERAAAAAERAAIAAERAAAAAERQADEAERANRRATIALVLAIISIIIAAVGAATTAFPSLWPH
jgi:hypothetical protein